MQCTAQHEINFNINDADMCSTKRTASFKCVENKLKSISQWLKKETSASSCDEMHEVTNI